MQVATGTIVQAENSSTMHAGASQPAGACFDTSTAVPDSLHECAIDLQDEQEQHDQNHRAGGAANRAAEWWKEYENPFRPAGAARRSR
jgi:hypothetical protein